MSAVIRRKIVAVLEAGGPMEPSALDLAADLEPGVRATVLGGMWRDGVVVCDPPAAGKGPVTWRLPSQTTSDLRADDLTRRVSPSAGTAAPNMAAEERGTIREEQHMAQPAGVWTNRVTGGAVLCTSATLDGDSWNVYVEGATHPIPVMAESRDDIPAVIESNGMTVVRIEPAESEHMPAPGTPSGHDAAPSKESSVTDQIAEGLAESESHDEIDDLLNSAASGEATQADAAGRPAKPDPKPGQKKATTKSTAAKPATGKSNPKPAQKKAAPKAAAEKPASRAEQTRQAQAARRSAANTAAAGATDADKSKAAADREAKHKSQVDQAVKLWNDPKFAKDTLADPGKRRAAVADKLNAKGRVMGLLRDGGIDARQAPAQG